MSQTRTPAGTMLRRALRLRCPRCGAGRLFRGWFRMEHACTGCGLKYERAPGYFLGSTYINYGLTAALVTIAYVSLRYVAGIRNDVILWPLSAFVVGFPLYFFRYARALWLAMDLSFDTNNDEYGQDDGYGNE